MIEAGEFVDAAYINGGNWEVEINGKRYRRGLAETLVRPRDEKSNVRSGGPWRSAILLRQNSPNRAQKRTVSPGTRIAVAIGAVHT